MKFEKATVHEHHEGWVIMLQSDGGLKALGVPCVDLKTATKTLELCRCNYFDIIFLNGTSVTIDHNTLDV